VDSQDRARIGAYLLGRLSADERDEFESRILEDPGLLASLRRTEAAILGGEVPERRATGRPCPACFVLGLVTGLLFASLVFSLL